MLQIEVLSPEDVARLRDGLSVATFQDGKATARGDARQVKANQQASGVEALSAFVRAALNRDPVFQAWARPARWSRLLFSRYRPGDAYGLHVDEAFMAAEGGGELRTDLSFTLFLSDPETYDGGELEVVGPEGSLTAKPAAGTAVLYDTGRVHQVAPVTAGERLAAVGWIQSRVREAERREVLFDLWRLRAALPDGEPRLTLDKSVGRLLRMWGAP